jgi:hypothetical protein
VNAVLPIVLIGLGGFLIGGVVAAVRNEAIATAVVLGLLAAACVVGGVLWLL